MESWIPPYKKKSAIPLRLFLYGMAFVFAFCAPVVYFVDSENSLAVIAIFLVLALGCFVPAVVARDVVLERVWENISWLRW